MYTLKHLSSISVLHYQEQFQPNFTGSLDVAASDPCLQTFALAEQVYPPSACFSHV